MHVLGKIIGVVKVDYAVFMRFYDVFVEQKAFCNILAYFACHVIALDADDSGIFVGVFLFYFFVFAFKKRQNLFVR